MIPELERAEAEAFASVMSAAGLPVTRVAGAVCFALPGIPNVQLNRVAGLGLERDPSDEDLDELRFRLLDWSESVEGGATEDEFVEYALAELADSGEDADTFVQAMPLWQSYRGLARWAEKRAAT